MSERFHMKRKWEGNEESVKFVIPICLTPQELYWIKYYGITRFDSVEYDKLYGQAVLTFETTIQVKEQNLPQELKIER